MPANRPLNALPIPHPLSDGKVVYQWHASRGSACLVDLLTGFRGILQSDGYQAYNVHAAKHPGIQQAACWTHVRRKFHEALQTGQHSAAGPLSAIARLYLIGKDLRQSRAGPEQRTHLRQQESGPVIERLRKDLLRLRLDASVLPKSPLGRAIDYPLTLWPKLVTYLIRGEIEIDTNLTENAKRHGHEPYAYLRDVLERLPAMKSSEIDLVLP